MSRSIQIFQGRTAKPQPIDHVPSIAIGPIAGGNVSAPPSDEKVAHPGAEKNTLTESMRRTASPLN